MRPDTTTESDSAITELGETGRVLIAELTDAIAARDAAEDRITLVRQALTVLIGDHDEATVDGQTVVTYRTHVSRRFDQATAKRFLTPEQIDACTVPVETRSFRRVTS